MALAVCAAVVANAAACTWSITGAATASIKSGSDVWSAAGAANSAAAYLILASDVGSVTSYLDANGKMDTSKAVGTVTSGDINAKGRFTNVAVDLSSATTAYSMVLVYTDKDDASKIHYQFSSGTASGSGSDDPMTPAVAVMFATSNFSASGWTAAAAPEPTSGLLMLLGLAGLALKRKRA